uniref:Uncharacterized protein n=1 Tax=Kalanchoe fedtschenkoi TaxID=63787 RepID=A0A7N0U0E7_KALFE
MMPPPDPHAAAKSGHTGFKGSYSCIGNGERQGCEQGILNGIHVPLLRCANRDRGQAEAAIMLNIQ